VSSSSNTIVGHSDSLFFVGARVGLLATLSAVTRLFVVLLLDCDATFNGKGVGTNIDLVVYLISSSALVTGTNSINLV
jgi:hypothetical protein